MSTFETGFYTPAEAAHRLGLTTARVRQLMAAERLPFVRTPLGRLLDAAAVDALVQARIADHRLRQETVL